MTDRELMQQALENNTGEHRVEGAKNILRDRLAQPEQEPAARLTCEELGYVPLSADGKSVYIDGVGLVRLAQPEQESFSPEAIRATQAAWKMGYDAAKAEQPEQKPVPGVVMRYGFPTLLPDRDIKSTDVRLYTTPPQRTWVGLMDEQIDNVTRKQVDALLDHIYEYGTAAEGIDLRVRAVARAIEAKLKEKNA